MMIISDKETKNSSFHVKMKVVLCRVAVKFITSCVPCYWWNHIHKWWCHDISVRIILIRILIAHLNEIVQRLFTFTGIVFESWIFIFAKI